MSAICFRSIRPMSQVPALIARRPLARQDTAAEMEKLGKTYTPHVFVDGASHGFLLAQADRKAANLKAAREAWPLTVTFLRAQLKS
jgi:dienelactone hydrolase